MTQTKGKTKRTVGIALLAAMVVVLQLVATPLGTLLGIPISLVLIPIVIGAIMFGAGAGALLGAVFGAVTLIMGISGADRFTATLWNMSPFATAAICFIKGAAAGAAAGAVYKALCGRHDYPAAMCASVVCPVINTALFCISFAIFFSDYLKTLAGGTNTLTFMFVSLIGINFIIELTINVVFAPAVVRIVKAVSK